MASSTGRSHEPPRTIPDPAAGEIFGRLTVIDPTVLKVCPSVPRGLRAALCKCICGREVTVTVCNLRDGTAQSCGCLFRDRARESALQRHAPRRRRR